MNQTLVNQLEEIVNRGLSDALIPIVTKNTVRIKQFLVRKTKTGYLVINLKEGEQLAHTKFKCTAIAIAKTLAAGKDHLEEILELETKMEKHYNDALFYQNIINKTNDEFIRESRETRLDIAIAQSERVREKIDHFIFI
jgi:hypothetical protein